LQVKNYRFFKHTKFEQLISASLHKLKLWK
jgi:hypothetical protein